MIVWMLDHPFWCGLAVTLLGYAIASVALWPRKDDR